METLKAHWPEALAALLVLLGLVNRMLPPGRPQNFVTFLIDLLSPLSRRGMSGVIGPLSAPGIPSLPKQPPTGPAVALLLAVALSGCSPIPTLLRTTASTAVVVGSGYRALDAYDEKKETECLNYARENNDIPAARLCLEDWRPKYLRGRLALDIASGVVESAMAAVPTIELGTNAEQRRNVGEWLNKLVPLATDLVKILNDLGVKVK